jgi:hypothetical protein
VTTNTGRDLVKADGGLVPVGPKDPTHVVFVGDCSTSMRHMMWQLEAMLRRLAMELPAWILCKLAIFNRRWNWMSDEFGPPKAP